MSIVRSAVPGLSLSWISAPMRPTSHLYRPSVCICVRGQKRIVFGDTAILHSSDQFLLTAVEVPTIVSIDEASPDDPYVGLQIDLDLDIAQQVIAEVDAGRLQTTDAPSCMTTDTLTPTLFDAVVRLAELTVSRHDISMMAPLIHREIIYRIASGPTGGRLRQILKLDSSDHRLVKAVSWIREHYSENLRIDDLATVAGMGTSTLHRRFQQVMRMSPIQYQKTLRLHEARRLLLAGNTDSTSAAICVGYESVSQFAREYRRLFGLPPMRDIHALTARKTGS